MVGFGRDRDPAAMWVLVRSSLLDRNFGDRRYNTRIGRNKVVWRCVMEPEAQYQHRRDWVVLVSDAEVHTKLRCMVHSIFDEGFVADARAPKLACEVGLVLAPRGAALPWKTTAVILLVPSTAP